MRIASITSPFHYAPVLVSIALASACGADENTSGENDPDIEFVSVNNMPGSFDADFTGEGGSAVESFTWENPLPAAEYSMDITATAAGRVDVTVQDADGKQVASFYLGASSPDDTLDGVSLAGTPGSWTIEISIDEFEGDGSVSLGSAEEGDN